MCPARKRDLHFLLDEGFSWRLGVALELLGEYPIKQVQLIPDLGHREPGELLGTRAKDEDIARWCADMGYVLVSDDDDFRSRELRSGLFRTHDVELIWVDPQPKGLHAQVELVIRNYPTWVEMLGSEPPGYRAWLQKPGPRGRLKRLPR